MTSQRALPTPTRRRLAALGRFRQIAAVVALVLPSVLALSPAAWAQGEGAAAAPAGTAATAEATSEIPPVMPDVISTYGHKVDGLFFLILYITGAAGIIVLGLMAIFLVKYRHRPGQTTASGTHGSNLLEVTWTVGTAAILIFIAFSQRESWIEIKQTLGQGDGETAESVLKNPDTVLVRVYAEQFAWYFNYPGADGVWETQRASYADPINKVGLDDPSKDKVSAELVVPVDTTIVLELHSLGKYNPAAVDESKKYTWPVLHSFFSPHLRLKQDVVPFLPSKIWFRVLPGKEGKYEIACAELCGEGHYAMHAPFRVVSKEEFGEWLGYDYTQAHPGGFPEVVHYHQEKKD